MTMQNTTSSISRAFLNIAEAAQYLGVCKKTVRKAVVTGRIPNSAVLNAHARPGKIQIRLTELEAYRENGLPNVASPLRRPTRPTPTAPSVSRAFLNLKEAAHYMGVSVRTVRRAVHAGAIPHNRTGFSECSGKILIRRTDLEAYLEKGRINA
jgi:excisionase family DNA binding protein